MDDTRLFKKVRVTNQTPRRASARQGKVAVMEWNVTVVTEQNTILIRKLKRKKITL